MPPKNQSSDLSSRNKHRAFVRHLFLFIFIKQVKYGSHEKDIDFLYEIVQSFHLRQRGERFWRSRRNGKDISLNEGDFARVLVVPELMAEIKKSREKVASHGVLCRIAVEYRFTEISSHWKQDNISQIESKLKSSEVQTLTRTAAAQVKQDPVWRRRDRVDNLCIDRMFAHSQAEKPETKNAWERMDSA